MLNFYFYIRFLLCFSLNISLNVISIWLKIVLVNFQNSSSEKKAYINNFYLSVNANIRVLVVYEQNIDTLEFLLIF